MTNLRIERKPFMYRLIVQLFCCHAYSMPLHMDVSATCRSAKTSDDGAHDIAINRSIRPHPIDSHAVVGLLELRRPVWQDIQLGTNRRYQRSGARGDGPAGLAVHWTRGVRQEHG